MEQRSLHSHTGKDLWWNTTEIRDHNTHWCQRKSGWCAFSCHKCIDVRHRHSSPLSTEWLALVFLCIFFYYLFLSFLKKMSQCKKQVGWPPARFEQLTLDVCVFICEVWKYQSCCCFSSFSSVLGRQMLSFQGSEFMQATTTVSIQSIHEIKQNIHRIQS